MAYAYKRGKTWYVRHRRADGTYACVSRDESGNKFGNERAAEDWGNAQEADVRRGLWLDPRSGDVTLTDWVKKWWPAFAAGLALRTRDNYLYCIEVHLLPVFGTWPLNTITPVDVAAWEQQMRADGYAANTVINARSRLVTILGDAVTQGLIKSNPALRQRRRGRAKGAEQPSEKVWPTPLQALLHAERCALLSGRDDDLIMILLMAYTGMRWGETMGLQWEFVHLSNVRVEWQLVERNHFFLLPPKYGSRRTIDIPPFLSDLLSDMRQRRSTVRCRCKPAEVEHPEEPCPGGREHVFLGPGHGHPRGSNYRERIFYPAAHGQTPAVDGKRPRPKRPVFADISGHWPGVPAVTATPSKGEPFWPASGFQRRPKVLPVRSTSKLGDLVEYAVSQGMEAADAKALGREELLDRYVRASYVWDPTSADPCPLVAWLPLLPGLTPHGLRHGQQVWMDDLGTLEPLQVQRMGHTIGGVRGVYKHVLLEWRQELKDGLQELWKTSLAERSAISPRSPVPLLDQLLEPLRAAAVPRFSRKIRANRVRALSG